MSEDTSMHVGVESVLERAARLTGSTIGDIEVTPGGDGVWAVSIDGLDLSTLDISTYDWKNL